jgi:predicted MFS family arabinose efflux permease
MAAVPSSSASLAAGSLRRDARVIGLVATAHCTSHVFQLVLPPLFPLLRAEFGASYAALGLVMSVFFMASAACQLSAGFVVDRIGARPVLLFGLAMLAIGAGLAALAPSYAWLLPAAAVMGLGNGVFHPVDFAILNARVLPQRLGHAFSTHGVGGSLGYAVAPVLSFALGSAFGWRTALVAFVALALVMLLLMATQGPALATEGHRGRRAGNAVSGFSMFRQPAMLLCFVFFALLTIGSVAVQTFAPTALHLGHGIPLAVATSALTAYLLGSTAGVVAGGFLVTRMRHDRVAAGGLALSAALVLLAGAVALPAAVLLPVFALAGFALGITNPSRDMIVRSVTPPGASGRTYGFVYSGLDLGSTIGPLAAGALLDGGAPNLVLVGAAVAVAAAIVTVLQAGGLRRQRTPRVAAAARQ